MPRVTATVPEPVLYLTDFEDSSGEDISEGLTGLPMQLCLRLSDGQGAPLARRYY